MSNIEEDRVYAHKFAIMKKQINEKDERIKELEEGLLKVKDKNIKLFMHYKNSIPVQKVKDLKKSIILEPTIVGGRRNAKTLEYGIKLGKIKACEELLEEK